MGLPWDTSSCMSMMYMFAASRFNGNISKWDVSSVVKMYEMFGGNVEFNQDLSSWNVSAVTNMAYMFWQTDKFNQDLSSWDVGAVTNMDSMFCETKSFDQELCWDVSDKNTPRMLEDSKGGCISIECCGDCDRSLICKD